MIGHRVYNTGKVQIGLLYSRAPLPVSTDAEWVQAAFLDGRAVRKQTLLDEFVAVIRKLIYVHP